MSLAWKSCAKAYGVDSFEDVPDDFDMQIVSMNAVFDEVTGKWGEISEYEPGWYSKIPELPEGYENEWLSSIYEKEVLQWGEKRSSLLM